jgi:uncharacterized protein DUF3263
MSRTDHSPLGRNWPTSLDAFDRAMIEFAVQWEPYGGPREEDIFPQFGLTLDRLFARIESIIDAHNVLHMTSPADRQLIQSAVRVLASYRGQPCDQDMQADSASCARLAVPPKFEWRLQRGIWRSGTKRSPG